MAARKTRSQSTVTVKNESTAVKREPEPEAEVGVEPAVKVKSSPAVKVKSDPASDATTSAPSPLETPALCSKPLRMSYQIARGEQGVLTFEPYKSALLPLWRFRTPSIAEKSSTDLRAKFEGYGDAGDFVGMDMARKFIQMGMTRAKRYANHKGGRKYAAGQVGADGKRVELPKSGGHEGMEEKERASLIFREVWMRCREDETYLRLRDEFLAEQKEWKKSGGS